jgi:MFS transporter, ACS family, tartrate transporter
MPMAVIAPPHDVDPGAIRRKVAWHILPLIVVLYLIAYLDRVNAGYAKLKMQDALHFDDKVFGRAFGIFSIGYLLLEIPGALIVARWSARKWFARILISWGLCSMGMALVSTPGEFYAARFLLGLAEAGFFPGVIVYLTHWFTRADRARALAVLVFGIPLGLALGARVSGWLLEVKWFGLGGWQWVFIVEGLPAVLMGAAVPFIMTDRPRDARWLTPAEREWLDAQLEAERRETSAIGGQAMRQPAVWLLAIGIMAVNTGGHALQFWLPTVVKNLLKDLGVSAGDGDVMNWLSLVYLCGFIGVLLAGRNSDRTGERKWHCVAGMTCTGVFLALSVVPGQPWGLVFFWLCLMGFFAWAWPPPFWVLPSQTLSAAAVAVSIGFINMCANIAGTFGNEIMGGMKDAGYADRACLLVLAGFYVVGGAIVSRLRVPKA